MRTSRTRVSASLNPELVDVIDAFVRDHPGTDRSKVIDEALQLWCERELSRAMEAQYADEPDAPDDEYAAWETLRRAATVKNLSRRAEDDEG